MGSKKNPNGNGTIRKRKDGLWEGRYVAGTDPSTGKPIRESVYGKTRRTAAEKLNKALCELNAGTYVAPNKITVGSWAETWLEDFLVGDKPHTQKSYADTIKNHIAPALKDVKLQELDAVRVQKFINSLRNQKDPKKPLSAKTVKNIHGVLHSMLGVAKRVGYISSNPADNIALPKRTKPEIFPLQGDQVPTFINLIKGHDFEDFYLVALFTGLRESELIGLRWSDVNIEAGTITVKQQLQFLGGERGYQYSTPKNGKFRTVPIPEKAYNALIRQKERQKALAEKLGNAWENEGNLVFTNNFGKHLKHNLVYNKVKIIFAAMGLPDLRLHDLRHSYAVMCIEAGVDMKTIQENLGHHSLAFTMDTYGFVTDRMRRESASKLDDYIEKAQGESESQRGRNYSRSQNDFQLNR